MSKRITQQLTRVQFQTNPRLCPDCRLMIGTHKGRFNRHGTSDKECPGSGKKVAKAS